MPKPDTTMNDPLDDAMLDEAYDTLADDESWDDGQDVVDDAPPKKKGKLFTVVVIGAGVVLFLGIMYLQVQQAPQPQSTTAPVVAAASPADTVGDTITPIPATPAPVALDASVPLTPMPGDEPPMPDPVVNTDIPDIGAQAPMPPPPIAMTEHDAELPSVQMTAPDQSSDTAAPQSAPVIPMIATPNDTDAAPVPTPEPTPAVQATVDGAPVPPLMSSVQLGPIEQRLERLETLVQNQDQAKPTVDPSAEVAALREQIDHLTKRLADLEGRAVAPVPASTPEPQVLAAQADLPKPAPTLVVDVVTSKTEPTPTPVTPTVTDPAPAPPKAEPSSEPRQVRPAYILRSVVNGRAYISKTMSSPLKTVSVGDDVEGLGPVTSIEKNRAGKWVVTTQKGTIRQK